MSEKDALEQRRQRLQRRQQPMAASDNEDEDDEDEDEESMLRNTQNDEDEDEDDDEDEDEDSEDVDDDVHYPVPQDLEAPVSMRERILGSVSWEHVKNKLQLKILQVLKYHTTSTVSYVLQVTLIGVRLRYQTLRLGSRLLRV